MLLLPCTGCHPHHGLHTAATEDQPTSQRPFSQRRGDERQAEAEAPVEASRAGQSRPVSSMPSSKAKYSYSLKRGLNPGGIGGGGGANMTTNQDYSVNLSVQQVLSLWVQGTTLQHFTGMRSCFNPISGSCPSNMYMCWHFRSSILKRIKIKWNLSWRFIDHLGQNIDTTSDHEYRDTIFNPFAAFIVNEVLTTPLLSLSCCPVMGQISIWNDLDPWNPLTYRGWFKIYVIMYHLSWQCKYKYSYTQFQGCFKLPLDFRESFYLQVLWRSKVIHI